MRNKSILVVTGAMAAMLSLGACGGDDAVAEKPGTDANREAVEKYVEEVTGGEVDLDEDNLKVETKDGSVATNKLPEGFPDDLPLPDGYEVTGSMTTAEDVTTAVLLVADDNESVVQQIQSGLSASGYTLENPNSVDLGEATSFGVVGHGNGRDVTVSVFDDGSGKIVVTYKIEPAA